MPGDALDLLQEWHLDRANYQRVTVETRHIHFREYPEDILVSENSVEIVIVAVDSDGEGAASAPLLYCYRMVDLDEWADRHLEWEQRDGEGEEPEPEEA